MGTLGTHKHEEVAFSKEKQPSTDKPSPHDSLHAYRSPAQGELSVARESSTRGSTAHKFPHLEIIGSPGHSIPTLDAKQSVESLVKSGVLKAADIHSTGPSHKDNTSEKVTKATDSMSKQMEPLHVKVVPLSTLKYDERQKANFIVKGDGTVQVNNNPEHSQSLDIVVAVEQQPASAAQSESTGKLLSYLSQHMSPDKSKLLKIAGDQALVPPETLRKLDSAHVAREKAFGSETSDAISKVNKDFDGTGPRVMHHSDVQDYIPQRQVPARADESKSLLSTKDAVAGLYKGEYNTARHGSDGWSIGRYGMHSELAMSWLSGLLKNDPELAAKLGNPPDPSKLAELMKDPKFSKELGAEMQKLAAEGKVSKEFADKFNQPGFAQDFAQFINKMSDKNAQITSAEVINFLPKELQETIVSSELSRISGESKNPLESALAFRLGHKPTESDLHDPANQQYMLAASKLMQLSQADRNAGDNGTVLFTGDNQPASSMAAKLARAAENVAASTGTVGYCASGVQQALANCGMPEFLGSGNGWDMRSALENSGKFKQISASEARPGDIGVQRWAPDIVAQHGGKQYGDIFIVGSVQNGRVTQLNDHKQDFNPANSRYDKRVFYRYEG
ncbi:hypothetical protein BH10CYA1_BH10CYA1_48600 [soil metagenome]